jgi:ribosomal protein S18 acetylase RimI-like enzyme
MQVRAALPSDVARVGELWRSLEALHAELQPGFFRPPRQAALAAPELVRLLGDRNRLLAVAEVDRHVIGLAHAQLYDTPPLPLLTPKRRAHVDTLIVDLAHRRRGAGRALLDEVGRWARFRGADEVLLTLWDGNEAAQAFYRAVGFHTVNVCMARPTAG